MRGEKNRGRGKPEKPRPRGGRTCGKRSASVALATLLAAGSAAGAAGADERWGHPVGFVEELSSSWAELGDRQQRRHTLSWEGIGEGQRFSLFFAGASFSSQEQGGKKNRPEGSAISAGMGFELSAGWQVAADLATARDEDSTGGGSALSVKLTGKIGGIGLEAGFAEVEEAFFEPGRRREEAGTKSHLELRRVRERWKVQGRLAVEEAESGREETITALSSRVELPGGVDTKLELERKQVAGVGEQVESLLRVEKKWERWDLSVKDTQREQEKQRAVEPLRFSSLDATVRFRPSDQWQIAAGTVVEERVRPRAFDASRTFFLAPTWMAPSEALAVRMELDYATEEQPSGLRGEGFRGEGSLEWQARCEGCSASLALDFSWTELGDAPTRDQAGERRAEVRVTLGFPPFLGGG